MISVNLRQGDSEKTFRCGLNEFQVTLHPENRREMLGHIKIAFGGASPWGDISFWENQPDFVLSVVWSDITNEYKG